MGGRSIYHCISNSLLIILVKAHAVFLIKKLFLFSDTTIDSQVLNLIPKEGEGESFVDALARVRRCLGGGGATDNADSDSDLEVVTESVTVSLRCPVSFHLVWPYMLVQYASFIFFFIGSSNQLYSLIKVGCFVLSSEQY